MLIMCEPCRAPFVPKESTNRFHLPSTIFIRSTSTSTFPHEQHGRLDRESVPQLFGVAEFVVGHSLLSRSTCGSSGFSLLTSRSSVATHL